MTNEEYVKNTIEEIKEKFINSKWYGAPYVMEYWQEVDELTKVTNSRLEEILDSGIMDIGYFTDDDGIDGGVIESVAYQFDKILPEDNDFDMRYYPSFWLYNEDARYYVIFLEDWPNK